LNNWASQPLRSASLALTDPQVPHRIIVSDSTENARTEYRLAGGAGRARSAHLEHYDRR
jgi:hypothetical protein